MRVSRPRRGIKRGDDGDDVFFRARGVRVAAGARHAERRALRPRGRREGRRVSRAFVRLKRGDVRSRRVVRAGDARFCDGGVARVRRLAGVADGDSHTQTKRRGVAAGGSVLLLDRRGGPDSSAARLRLGGGVRRAGARGEKNGARAAPVGPLRARELRRRRRKGAFRRVHRLRGRDGRARAAGRVKDARESRLARLDAF